MEKRIREWVSDFQAEIEAYLKLRKMRRGDLAAELGMAQSSISRNLAPDAVPTENFIRLVAERLPGFEDAWTGYLAAKAGRDDAGAWLVRDGQPTYRDQVAQEALDELRRLAREIEKKIEEFERRHGGGSNSESR